MIRPAAAGAREVAGVDSQAELLGLAAVLLDLLWMHPLLALLGGAGPDGLARISLWPLVVLALLARGVVWLLASARLAGPAFTIPAGILGLLSLAGLLWVEFYAGGETRVTGDLWRNILAAVTTPGLLGVLLAGGYCWWRTLGADLPGLGAAYGRFQLIIGTYLCYAGLAWFGRDSYLTPVLTRDLFLVFLAGLSATALARSRMEGARSHQLLSTRWFLFSLSLIAVVLGVGLLAGSLFAPGLAAALFGPLWTAVQVIGLVVILVLGAAAAIVFRLIDLLFGWIHFGAPPITPTPTPVPNSGRSLHDLLSGQGTSPPLDTTLLTVVGVLVLLVIFVLLGRGVLASAQSRRRTIAQGERESLLDWGALWGSLRAAPAAPAAPDPLLALGRDPAYRYTVRVRQIYREALARAAARDVARLPAQTADEVLPALARAFPAAVAPLDELTAIYDATRYTTTPAGPAAAAAAARALRALDAPPESR